MMGEQVYIFISLPLYLAFDIETKDGLRSLDIFIDVFFLTDVVLGFCTTYVHDNGAEEFDLGKIAKNYLKTWFVIDVAISLPYGLILTGVNNIAAAKLLKVGRLMRSSKAMRSLRLLRTAKMSKMAKLARFFEECEDELMDMNLHYIFDLARGFMILTFFLHILSCIFYASSSADSRNDWITHFDFDDTSLGMRYLASMYFVCTTMTTVGYGDITPQSNAERAVTIAIMLIGVRPHSLSSSHI